MAQRDLKRCRRCAERLQRARAELREAIVAAHRSGESTRDIAEYVGMSHSRIAELLREANQLEREG